ncbi:MAG: MFS transporter, partial [Erysipelotrichales bacterium]
MIQRKLAVPFSVLLILTLAIGTSLQITMPTIPVYLRSLGLPLSALGFSAAIISLAALLSRPVAAWCIQRMSSLTTIIIGSGFYLAVFSIYLLFKDPMIVITARILQGIGIGLVSTALGTLVTQLLPKEQLLGGMSLFTLANAATGTLGAAWGMILIEGGAYPRLFFVGGALVLVSLFLIIFLGLSIRGHLHKVVHAKQVKVPFYKNPALKPAMIVLMLIMANSSLINFLSFFAIQKGISSIGFFFLYGFVGLLLSRVFLSVMVRRLSLYKLYFINGLLYALVFYGLTISSSVFIWTSLS